MLLSLLLFYILPALIITHKVFIFNTNIVICASFLFSSIFFSKIQKMKVQHFHSGCVMGFSSTVLRSSYTNTQETMVCKVVTPRSLALCGLRRASDTVLSLDHTAPIMHLNTSFYISQLLVGLFLESKIFKTDTNTYHYKNSVSTSNLFFFYKSTSVFLRYARAAPLPLEELGKHSTIAVPLHTQRPAHTLLCVDFQSNHQNTDFRRRRIRDPRGSSESLFSGSSRNGLYLQNKIHIS